MDIVAIDTEYDYLTPFLATSTNAQLQTTVYRLEKPSHVRRLKRLCQNPDRLKVFHNITADKSRLLNIGIRVRKPYACTMLASTLVNENYAPKALKKLAQLHLGEDVSESKLLKTLIAKYKKKAKEENRQFKWSDIPNEVMLPYAKKDPEYTIKLWYYFMEPLKRAKVLFDFEMKLVPVIVSMHQKGLRIDRAFVEEQVDKYARMIVTLQAKLNRILQKNCSITTVNPGSPKQVGAILDQLGLDIVSYTKTGLPSTDKDSLLLLDHPFIDTLLQYRFYAKHLSTYYKPLLYYYTSPTDDIAHFDLYQAGTKTGRFSAELIQTFPRPGEDVTRGTKQIVRQAVIPRKGFSFLCIDYCQIEMWLFVHYANCERLIKIAVRGMDVYLETARMLFGDLMKRPELVKPLRTVAKTMALSLIYGMGIGALLLKIVQMLKASIKPRIMAELQISRVWASQVLKDFYAEYPVQALSTALSNEVYKKGYIELDIQSPLMNVHRYYHIPSNLAYKAPNAKIQGTAAYIIKHAMLRCRDIIRLKGWENSVTILMQVHDELIFEVSNKLDLPKIAYILCLAMEDTVSFRVPIYAEPKISARSWADTQKLEVFHEQA